MGKSSRELNEGLGSAAAHRLCGILHCAIHESPRAPCEAGDTPMEVNEPSAGLIAKIFPQVLQRYWIF